MWRFRVFAASWFVLLAYWAVLGAALVTAEPAEPQRSAAARRDGPRHVEGICVRRGRGGRHRADRAADIRHWRPARLRGRRFCRPRRGACRFPLCARGAFGRSARAADPLGPCARRSRSAARCCSSASALAMLCAAIAHGGRQPSRREPAAQLPAADLPAHDRESDDLRDVRRASCPSSRSQARSRSAAVHAVALAAGSASVTFAIAGTGAALGRALAGRTRWRRAVSAAAAAGILGVRGLRARFAAF